MVDEPECGTGVWALYGTDRHSVIRTWRHDVLDLISQIQHIFLIHIQKKKPKSFAFKTDLKPVREHNERCICFRNHCINLPTTSRWQPVVHFNIKHYPVSAILRINMVKKYIFHFPTLFIISPQWYFLILHIILACALWLCAVHACAVCALIGISVAKISIQTAILSTR